MSTVDIEWVDDLPPITAPGSRHAEIIETLKTRPGQWAKIASKTTHSGGTQPFAKRGCETAQRGVGKNDDGKRVYDLYARWPEPKPAAEPRHAPEQAAPVSVPRLVPPRIERPGRPRRQQGETEQAFEFRLKRWERGVPAEGKALAS